MGETGPAQVVEDATCLACGCLCDDIRVHASDGRVVAADHACPIGLAWFTEGHPGVDQPPVTIDGQPAGFDEAIARAADLLGRSRSPLVWGLAGTTIEAQREALAIADAIGAAVEVEGSGSGMGWLAAYQRVGKVSATLGEVRDRADVVVFWRVDPIVSHPRFWGRFVEPAGTFVPSGRAGRTVVVVDSGPTATSGRADFFVPVEPDRSGDLLHSLRGLIRGKALDPARIERATGVPSGLIRDLADRLAGARYGAFVVGGDVRDAGEAEAALTLARDLNDGRRFVLIDLVGPGNPGGAEAVATWQAGAPTAIDFARGSPRFLPGEIDRGAVDALLIVSATSTPIVGVPTVLIGPGATRPDHPSSVAFDVTRAGIEAGGTVARSDGVMIPLRPALIADTRPTERDVLKPLGNRLRG